MRKGRLGLGVLGILVSLAVLLCTGLLPAAASDGNTVGMVIDPTPKTVDVGDNFSVDIKVTISAGEEVVVAEAYINFDPAYLEVVSITAGTALPSPLVSTFNNTAGTIDYGAGAAFGGAGQTEDFVLATLNLRAKAVTEDTALTFVYTLGRTTEAVVGFYDVLNHGAVINGSVEILPLGILSGHVALQGRPAAPHASWVTPLTVVFFAQGTDTVVRTENVTTDNTGNFTVTEVTTGIYDIGIKCSRSLSQLVTGVTFSGGVVTAVDFGTLLEGDANNDDIVTEADYAVLWSFFGQTSGEARDKCDFNRDGVVSGMDYALLWYNYGQTGEMNGMWP